MVNNMENIKLLTWYYASTRFTRYLYPVFVFIIVCSSFLFVPQLALSFNTREEHALKLLHSLRSSKGFLDIEEELIHMGPEILEILISDLDEELNKKEINREFVITVIRVLGQIHDPLSVHALLRATHIVDWIVSEEAVYALEDIIEHNIANLDMIIPVLGANDSYLQSIAKDAILKIGLSNDVTESLIEELQVSGDTTVRVFIVGLMSSIKGDKVINYLFSLLNDNDEEVRKEAVKVLHKKNVINTKVDSDTLLKIFDIIKDDLTFIELWEEVIKDLDVPDLIDVGFLINALRVAVKAESDSLKVKVTVVINRIGATALSDLNIALENEREGSPFYLELLDIINNIWDAANTTGGIIESGN